MSTRPIEKIVLVTAILLLFSCLFCVGNDDSTQNSVQQSLYYPASLAKKIDQYSENPKWQRICSELLLQMDKLAISLENRSASDVGQILTELARYQRIKDSEFLPVTEELQFRVALWGQLLEILNSGAIVSSGNNVSVQDLCELYTQTDKIHNSLKKVKNGEQCIQYLKLDLLHDRLSQLMVFHGLLEKTGNPDDFLSSQAGMSKNIVKKDNGDIVFKESEIHQILSAINETLYMERQVADKPQWQDFVNSPLVVEWKKCLTKWHSDLVDPFRYIGICERYLSEENPSDGILLAQLTPRMTCSKSIQYQNLGNLVGERFSQPHLKMYVSKFLLNRMLPTRDPEFDVVRDSVAGQQVYGRRRTDTQVQMDLIPDPQRLMLSLNVLGKVRTSTTATTFPATVQNQSYADYFGKKRLELTTDGIRVSPAEVAVYNNKVQLRNISTDFDVVPLVGDLIKDIAISQYENQQGFFESETKKKIINQAKYQIDQEVNERLLALNNSYQRSFLNILHSNNASLQQKQYRTTEDWLMASWFLATPASLGSHTSEPETPAGSIADLKIHQSAVNAVIERLDLGGQCFSIGELRTHLLKRIQREDLDSPGENDDMVVVFEKENPISVRFEPNKVVLSLAFDCLQRDDNEWYDFQVFVHYVPGTSTTGTLCLVRDGYIQLKGENSLRTQMTLRTIFSKIFNDHNEIPLSPKFFKQDERFTEICTNHVRIRDGWFAIALTLQSSMVKQDNPNTVTK